MSDQTAETTKTEAASETLSLDDMTLEQLLAKADNHPWLSAIGIFEDDEVYKDWQQAIQDYRRSVDKDPDAL